MIVENDLKGLGFEYVQTPWKKEMTWIHTKNGHDSTDYIIDYDIKTQKAKALFGEFSQISRECTNHKDVVKFIDAIYFLNEK